MQSTSTRAKALKFGIDAVVEDFVKSGTNICIGSGSTDITIPLLDAAALSIGAGGLKDVAFIATNESTAALMEERNLPSDMAVNFKRSLDVFIAPAAMVDADYNIVLDSSDFAADKFAAETANQIVVVVHEDDFGKSRKGIERLPVQLCSFLPDVAAKSLCAKWFMDVGVRGCTLRSEGSSVADVALAPDVNTRFAVEELERTSAVVATGYIPNSSKTTIVLATNDFQPVDITSTLHTIANVSDENRKKRLTGEKRQELLRSLGDEWRLIEGQQEAVLRNFSFPSAGRAQAFVRYVHHVSSQAWHHPEIKESYNRVQICLTTHDAGGLSELDALFAGELGRVYDGMKASSAG